MRESMLATFAVLVFGSTVTIGVANAQGPNFNGDLYEDVAIAVPAEDFNQTNDGVVHVLYGTNAGLDDAGNQLWSQDISGIEGEAEDGDSFGWALAWGDFDCDGFDDLAVGSPFEDLEQHPGAPDAGSVNVIYGSAAGLTVAGNQLLTQPFVIVSEQTDRQFGHSVTAGDFDNDGCDDLAAGAPNPSGSASTGGEVRVYYGGFSGLGTTELWRQSSTGILDTSESTDRFGWTVAAGDFDHDGFDDLAIGVPTEETTGGGSATDMGAVNVIYGSASGLDDLGNQFWTQNSTGIQGTPEVNDNFGWALAVGRFDDDLFDDLAIGVPNDDFAATNAGAVNVLYGAGSGLDAAGDQLWTQDSDNVPLNAAAGDQFGFSVAAGDFDGDHTDDLAVGVPKRNIGGEDDSGAVTALYGKGSGLAGANSQVWHQNKAGIVGSTSEAGDFFGWSLAVGDFDNDTATDLAIGVPHEDLNTIVDVGAVQVLMGTTGFGGLTTMNNQFWTQNSPGISGGAEDGDSFGHALAGP